MPFKNPHVKFVSFTIEVTPAGIVSVMVIETDLHLNSRHPSYNSGLVQRLISAAQDYLAANADHVTHIRMVSNQAGEL